MKLQFIEPKKDQTEYIIGIDFGHGETSAAICRVDNNKDPEDIDLTGTGKEAIPSTIYIESKDGVENILIGKEAIAEYGKGGSGDFYAYFKQSPDTLDENKNPNIRIMKLFMRKVYETICTRRAGELMEGGIIKNNHVVFIACPSQSQKWGDNAMQNYVTLALEAGLPVAGASIDDKFRLSGIVRESRAAYIRALQKDEAKQIATKGILVIDYGSSTIDITYYKEGEKPIDRGYQLGASFVEKAIFNYLKEAHDDLEGDQNPEILKQIERTYPSLATKLLYSIRESKEKFYTDYAFANSIEIGFKFKPRVNADKIDVELSKTTITEEIIASYICDVKVAFEDFKKNVVKSNNVTLLVLTGGASRMNFVQDLAKSVFGENVKMLPPQDPSLTVSNGIATAGRADVLLYYLAKELLKKEINTIYQSVKSKTKEKICNKVICEVQDAYKSFLNGYLSTNTIDALEQKVNSNLNIIKSSYNELLNEAFRECLERCINEDVLFDIRKYIDTHFPHYNITKIERYDISTDTSIAISTDNLQTIDASINDSISQITEGFIEGTAKLAYNIFATLFFGTGALIDNAVIYIINKFRDKNNQIEYITIDDVMSLTMDFKDKNTDLNREQRQKVYETFNSKRSDYETLLKNDIEGKLPDFKKECDNVQKHAIEDYIVSEINRIQLQIK